MKKIALSVVLLLFAKLSFAQGSTDYGSGLKININPDGSKYMRVIAWNQIWLRSTDNNPGSAINGESASFS